jgi:outer membrane protein OmpA-like peptidoglycan-associated protein
MYLSKDGTSGYVSSNRPGGKGKDDIYSFSISKSLIEIIFPSLEKAPKEKEAKKSILAENKEKEILPNKYSISTKIGDVSVLDNIDYDLNSHKIKSGAAKGLDELLEIMQMRTNLKVQLSAHTDSRGSESFNQELSDMRAISARNYLINRGIESFRISALGFGESRIRNHCVEGADCTEEEHRFNRRTEVKILDN